MTKLNRWSMEFTDYNIPHAYIKGKDNVLADAISRLKTLTIYKEILENTKTPVASNTQENVREIHATDKHTISTTMLYIEQKWDIMCRKLVSQLCHSKKSSFKSVIIIASGILQKHQYLHGLKHDVTIAACSLVPTILHQFHDSKGHKGTIHKFEAIRRSYW